jgi:hypothetical protein
MANLPKPLIGLLVSTVLFFALWFVALKPSSSTSGGSPNGVGQYQSAINQAHQAVKTSNAANAKLGAPVSTTKSPASSTGQAASAATPKVTVNHLSPKQLHKLQHAFSSSAGDKWLRTQRAKVAADEKASAKQLAAEEKAVTDPAAAPDLNPAEELMILQDAFGQHDVVALLFYNPAAADDRAMEQELHSVPGHGGQVVKLAIPVSELTQFKAITDQIAVVTAPTLIIIDPSRQAVTLTGYASQLEINQRVANAVAVH